MLSVIAISIAVFDNKLCFFNPDSNHCIQSDQQAGNSIRESWHPNKQGPDYRKGSKIQWVPNQFVQSGGFQLCFYRLLNYHIDPTEVEEVFTDTLPHKY